MKKIIVALAVLFALCAEESWWNDGLAGNCINR